MAEKNSTEKLLTAKAVSEMLSLSKRQIFRMKSAGLICAPVKVGQGAIRWRQSDIERWIELGCPDRKSFEAMQGAGRD
jgi:predicted DNA-binding transcriptional regulator AlpA